MMRRQVFGWPAVAVAVFAVAAALQHLGYLTRLESGVAESRAWLLAHEVDSDVIIVGIDAYSLQALSEWPWPRRHHARLLQHLSRSDPAGVFFDIDFSAHSNPEDDALLERGLAAWEASPLLLASHFQHAAGASGEVVLTEPLPRFARHADLASVVLRPDPDGLVRTTRASWQIAGRQLRSPFSFWLNLPADAVVPLDFSILPSSFTYTSFVDVLNGRVDPATFDGKTVYIGAVAAELRDSVPVPVHRSLPGVVVQALALESARAGIIARPPAALLTALLLVATFASVAAFTANGWKRNALIVGGSLGLLITASVVAYRLGRLDVPVVPFVVALLLGFVVTTVRSLDLQTWRAIAYAIGLARKDALLNSVVESSIDCIVCVDGDGKIRTANPATSALFMRPPESVVGSPVNELLPGLFDGADSLSKLTGRTVEWSGRRNDADFSVEIALSRVGVDDEVLFTAVVRDISERKRQQAALEHQATHDALTGLPNRTSLNRRLSALLEPAGAAQAACLLMLDLCRFKEVNDTLGHDIGDQVLIEVADRLRSALDSASSLFRLGGDEFAVLTTDPLGGARIDVLVNALTRSLKAPITVQGIAIEISAGIGIAAAPEHAQRPRELLQKADVAMYGAKRHGIAFQYYDPAHDSHTVRRLAMVSELRTAIETNQLSVHYQPKVDLRSRRVRGVEALLRWNHPQLGRVSPGEFVPLAETTDLINPLTDWCIDRALRDLAGWRELGPALTVAVNVSARLVHDPRLIARLTGMLARHSIPAGRLEVEITETSMMLDPLRAQHVVNGLAKLGISISIDDYGTGYSSLGYLRDLKASALKLDQSFVIDLEQRKHNRVIVESTAHMAHALGLEVVAEGVETAWVARFLQRVGYDTAQGYYFARPMTAEGCRAFIAGFNSASPAPGGIEPARRAG